MREVLDTLGYSVRLRFSLSRRWFSTNRTLSPLIKQSQLSVGLSLPFRADVSISGHFMFQVIPGKTFPLK
jgi:hypothetical protein